jgi:hypothetical protein
LIYKTCDPVPGNLRCGPVIFVGDQVRISGPEEVCAEGTGAGSDPLPATDLRTGTKYTIVSVNADGVSETITDFTAIGAADNELGTTFTATEAGAGSGTAFVSCAPIKAELISDFEFEAGYQIATRGSYELAITVQGQNIAGSPRTLNIGASETAATGSTLSGLGIKKAEPDVETVFTINANDAYGNVVNVRALPGRLSGLSVPQRFPMKIHLVWCVCMGAQGA